MYLKELIRDYPMIQKHVHVYSPDLQGPLPITENLMGSNMYVDLYDEPEEVENMIDVYKRQGVSSAHGYSKSFIKNSV